MRSGMERRRTCQAGRLGSWIPPGCGQATQHREPLVHAHHSTSPMPNIVSCVHVTNCPVPVKTAEWNQEYEHDYELSIFLRCVQIYVI